MSDALNEFQPSTVYGLTDSEQADFWKLMNVWRDRLSGNKLRKRYYDQKNAVKGLGISVPDKLSSLSAVLGWPSKAVDELADRSVLEGFTFGGERDEWFDRMVDENDFLTVYDQALSAELIGSCAFCTVSAGEEGEPEVILSAYGPDDAAAIWDYRRKRIKAGLALVDVDIDDAGQAHPRWVNLYTSTVTASCVKGSDGRWRASRTENTVGRPLMEPLCYLPDTRRPFGKSRITRAVMSITDCAVREVQRSEIAAEFAALPQKYALGVDAKTFGADDEKRYRAWMGAILALTQNKNGETPTVGQFPQIAMQPHIDYMRSLALQFSGETGIPVSSLGVVQDNPSSAEAMYAAERQLIAKAERLNRGNGRALRNVARIAFCVRDGVKYEDLDGAAWDAKARFRDEVRSSKAANADYAIKLASSVPAYAKTAYFWRDSGYTEDEARDIMSQVSRAEAAQAIMQAAAQPQSQGVTGVAADDGGGGGGVPVGGARPGGGGEGDGGSGDTGVAQG